MRTVLVVGGSSSVGRHLRALLETRDDVKLLSPPRSRLDVTDAASVRAFAENLEAHVDAVAVLTGTCPGKNLYDYTDEDIARAMAVNFTGPARLVKTLLPRLSVGAHVLLTSSVAAAEGSYDPFYAASKAALVAFAKSLATWTAPRLRVNVVSPSLVAGSAMHAAMPAERRARHVEMSPLGRLTTLDEVAGIIASVLLDAAWASVNGQVIPVGCGRRAT